MSNYLLFLMYLVYIYSMSYLHFSLMNMSGVTFSLHLELKKNKLELHLF